MSILRIGISPLDPSEDFVIGDFPLAWAVVLGVFPMNPSVDFVNLGICDFPLAWAVASSPPEDWRILDSVNLENRHFPTGS